MNLAQARIDVAERAATARAYMTSPVRTVTLHASLHEVDRILQEYDLSALAVLDDDERPAGVISRSDLIRYSRSQQSARGRATLVLADDVMVRAAMTEDLVHVEPDAELSRVARLMAKRHIHRVFVVSGDEVVGVVSTKDVMQAIVDQRIELPIGEAMSKSIVSVQADEPMMTAVQRILASHKHGLVVLQGELAIGMVTMADILLAQHWASTTAVEEWMSPRVLFLPMGIALHRAAAQALAMHVRHILAMGDGGLGGIMTGIDFARVLGRRG